ncbi:MAG: hypothetical protein ABIY51_08750 [Ferruginibacter sp.]
MENIEITLNYRGADIDILITAEEYCKGNIYPVEMNGRYACTICMDENEDWTIMREADGTTPFIEGDLLKPLLKKLQYELQYAA